MFSGKQKVLDFIKLNNAPYWQVRRGEQTTPIMEYDPVPNLPTIDESLTKLSTLLNMLDNGTYFIMAWEKAGQTKGQFKDTFQINENGYGGAMNQQISGVQQVAGITSEEVEKRILEALERDREKRRYEEIEKQNKELLSQMKEIQSENQAFWLRLLKRAEPYIEPIMNGLGFAQPQPAPAISGLPKDETITRETMAKDLNERAEYAMEKWLEHDNDAITLMEEIVKLAETKPEVYKKAKNLLMNPGMMALFM